MTLTIKPMKLALFDLDHTLLPIDSDYTWSKFLMDIGILDEAAYEKRNVYFYEQYKAGTLDIAEFLDFQLRPLAQNSRQQLDAWHEQFMSKVITPEIKPAALQLVEQHRQEGAMCAIVTATNRFITEPIANVFGVDARIATEPEHINGEFTGKVTGTPSFREGKITRTEEWLQSMNKDWNSFESVHFYSDSSNDLPLMERVSHPVATNPDDKLAQLATERGWPILRLFE